ncbi:MAG: hypothetical protein Q4615_02990 [Paracoccus aminovorans]|nr:hypothetical protein [Paracoccus aminovorans]
MDHFSDTQKIGHSPWQPRAGFNPVNADTRLNLFHGFAPWRDSLLMPATARPGGLWQLDLQSNAVSRFDLPPPSGPVCLLVD